MEDYDSAEADDSIENERMIMGSKQKPRLPDHHDVQERCSDACNRALIGLLFLSACAIAMAPYLQQIVKLESFLRYYNLRVQLKNAYDQAVANPYWKQIEQNAGGPPVLANWRLEKVQKEFDRLSDEPTISPASSASVSASKVSSPLNAVISISVKENIYFGAQQPIIDLVDTKTLYAAMGYSNAYRQSIERYYELINRIQSYETTESGAVKLRKNMQDVWRNSSLSLTVHDLEILATKEFIEQEKMDAELEHGFVTLPWIKEKMHIILAAPLIGIFVCALQMYYLIFTKYMSRQAGYPLAGSLFAAANQDAFSKAYFTPVLLIPFFSLLALCIIGYPRSLNIIPVCAFSAILALLSIKHSVLVRTKQRAVVG